MIKFRVEFRRGGDYPEINRVEVTRETADYVWFGETRRAKRSAWDNFYDSFEEAKETLIQRSVGRLRRLGDEIENERYRMLKMIDLKEQST